MSNTYESPIPYRSNWPIDSIWPRTLEKEKEMKESENNLYELEKQLGAEKNLAQV